MPSALGSQFEHRVLLGEVAVLFIIFVPSHPFMDWNFYRSKVDAITLVTYHQFSIPHGTKLISHSRNLPPV